MSRTETLKKYPSEKSFLIRALYDLQSENPNNCLTEEDIEQTAIYFNVERTQILGVINYYKAFSLVPRAKNIVTICSSEICNARNEEKIAEIIRKELNIEIGQTTSDNLFTLQSRSCLGRCYDAPVVSINGEIYGELTVPGIKTILNTFRNF